MENNQTKPKVDITEGNVLRNVLYMGIPSMIGFGAMTIYGLTDIYWVGRLGTSQVAALTLFGAVAWVLSSVNMIVGTGSVAVISRRYGEKAYDAARDAILQTYVLKFAMGVVMSAVGILFVSDILRLMNAEADVLGHAGEYARIYLYGLPFMFSSYTGYTALRGVGDAPKAMHIMLASTALNVVLDPLFIFGLNMGVGGAALATVISASVGAALGIWVLSTARTNITIHPSRGVRPKVDLMVQIMKIGVPAGINSTARSMAHWFVATLVATFGTAVVASYGLSMRIMELGILFGVGLELGASAIVGQNLGAKKKERAHEAVVKATFLVMVLTGLLGAFEFSFARQLLGLFTPDQAVIEAGVPLLRMMALVQILVAMHITMSAAFYGSGNTWPPTVIALVTEWGIQIPLILLCVYVWRTTQLGVWWSMVAAASVEVIMTIVWFNRGHWKHRVV